MLIQKYIVVEKSPEHVSFMILKGNRGWIYNEFDFFSTRVKRYPKFHAIPHK